MLSEEFPDVYQACAYLYHDEIPFELPDLSKPLLMEVVVRGSGEKERRFLDYWQQQGFTSARRRVLMTCSAPVSQAACCALQVIRADERLAEQSLTLFRSQLDVLTVRLPAQLEREHLFCAVAPNGELAGALHYSLSGASATLEHIAVWPQYRRMGIAKALVSAWFACCCGPCKLWVIDDNTPAVKLYASMGFTDSGRSCYSLLYQK